MTEHDLIGYVFMATLGMFFILGLPAYYYVRRIRPAGKPPALGKVPTWPIQPLDLVVATGYIAFFVAGWKLSGEVDQEEALSKITPWTVAGNSLTMLFFAAFVPLVLFWRVRPTVFFGLNWPQWRWIFLIIPCFLAGVILVATSIALLGWQSFVEDRFGGDLQAMVQMIRETKDVALIAAMISAAVIGAPIAEEIIFRGYLYPVAKKYTSTWFAALFTGVLFGVVHMNLLGLPTLALMGVALAVLYERTGSLWVPVLCHMAFNGMQITGMLLIKFVPVPTP
jgi:membrane protease YdiL (CAAX protease family)